MSDAAEQQILDAGRIKAFLEDESVQGVLKRMHETYYKEFRTADTSEKRTDAWAKGRVLDNFASELVAVIDRGVMAKAELDRSTPRNRRDTVKKS